MITHKWQKEFDAIVKSKTPAQLLEMFIAERFRARERPIDHKEVARESWRYDHLKSTLSSYLITGKEYKEKLDQITSIVDELTERTKDGDRKIKILENQIEKLRSNVG